MLRTATPKSQADMLGAYLKEKGVPAKRSELLELVAKLNGAKNWQELQAVTGTERHTENSRMAIDLLTPLADRQNALGIIKGLKPFGSASGQESYYQGLFDILRGATSQVSPDAALRISRTVLQDLKKDVDFLIEVVSRKLGAGHVVDAIPDDWALIGIHTIFSEDEPFVLHYNGEYYDMDDNFMAEVISHAVVSELTVAYPRGDRYGVPFEATQDGGEEWTLENGFKVSSDFEVYGEDTRDDSVMSFELSAYVSPELYTRIERYIEDNYSSQD